MMASGLVVLSTPVRSLSLSCLAWPRLSAFSILSHELERSPTWLAAKSACNISQITLLRRIQTPTHGVDRRPLATPVPQAPFRLPFILHSATWGPR
ncbi:hypothetical protein F5148DRAFT_1237940, partial [Russula earlei]